MRINIPQWIINAYGSPDGVPDRVAKHFKEELK